MTYPRKLTYGETVHIGAAIGEPFVFFGHPLTCNGGNLDFASHHDHEVVMLLNGPAELICPECRRTQSLPENWSAP